MKINVSIYCADFRCFSVCPSSWEFSLPHNVENIDVIAYINPKIIFEWEEFTVINKMTKKPLNINKEVHISYFQSFQF